jgi:hypothetical protein
MNGTDDQHIHESTPDLEIKPAPESRPESESQPEPYLTRLRKGCRRWRHQLLPSASYTRLGDTLPVSRKELDSLIARQPQYGPTHSILNDAEEMLRNAQDALEQAGNPELGWRWFKASRQLQVYAMPDKEELLARARSILREASDKEKGVALWRRATIKELLADSEGKLDESVKDRPDKVAYAAKILDEHHDNVYQKSAIIRGRLKVLALMTVLALAVWVVVLPPLPPAEAHVPMCPRIFWLTIVVSGVIGAIISGFTSSIKGGGAKRIPIELDFSAVTFARLALGALSALAVTACLNAGILKLSVLSYELMLAASILAGFSERLLLRALESTGG